MNYLERYRAELVSVLKRVDLNSVDEVVTIFREARAHGRCIFICAAAANAIAASHLLCELVRAANVNHSMKFRIFVLYDGLSPTPAAGDDARSHRVLVDELVNVASPGDVIVGIYVSGGLRALLEAFEYANHNGCRTICLAGAGAEKLAKIADAAILVPAEHPANVEDTQMIICRMIGDYFIHSDPG